MASGADVRSIDALRDWLIALGNYRSSIMEVQSGLDMEIRRAFDWLEDQGKRWKTAVKDCEEEVLQAKNALASRKFTDSTGRMPDTTVQERDLRRAKARLEQAEEQVAKCRSWLMKLPKIIEENFTGSTRRLRTIVEADMPGAMAGLERKIAILDSYAELQPDFAPAPSTANLSSGNAKPAEPPKESP
ncbi:hypothetical protein [Limnoglobus roseus]|uniref:Uncharacterized protein n=1 Tax=Limnoglobus roseus TaxID=2598579 RepID=A0A5C1A8U2_9BACT|nr:hypothetical protein [Limnoglobus roseus]QEL14935.1 hypothetical protein PX52LOC_01836 [Limnoglobus roseus]